MRCPNGSRKNRKNGICEKKQNHKKDVPQKSLVTKKSSKVATRKNKPKEINKPKETGMYTQTSSVLTQRDIDTFFEPKKSAPITNKSVGKIGTVKLSQQDIDAFFQPKKK
jgi:hypothetical protein